MVSGLNKDLSAVLQQRVCYFCVTLDINASLGRYVLMVSMTAGPATGGPHQGEVLTGHVHGRGSLPRTKCSPKQKACMGGGTATVLAAELQRLSPLPTQQGSSVPVLSPCKLGR